MEILDEIIRFVGNFSFTKVKLFTDNKFKSDTPKFACWERRGQWDAPIGGPTPHPH